MTTENNGLSITTTSGQLLVSEGQSFQLTTGTVNGVTDFFLGGHGHHFAAGHGRRAAGRVSDGARPGHSQRAQLARSTGLRHLDAGECAEQCGHRSGWRDRNGGESALYLQRAGAGGGQRGGDERGDDRSRTRLRRRALGDGTGDNSNAVAMANLASQTIVNGQTPINYYSNFVSTLGSTVSEVQTENTAQNASVTQLQTQNNALSSVNLNDEAAAMSTLESSYQAASQVFTMLNTIMASALNLGEQTAVS